MIYDVYFDYDVDYITNHFIKGWDSKTRFDLIPIIFYFFCEDNIINILYKNLYIMIFIGFELISHLFGITKHLPKYFS